MSQTPYHFRYARRYFNNIMENENEIQQDTNNQTTEMQAEDAMTAFSPETPDATVLPAADSLDNSQTTPSTSGSHQERHQTTTSTQLNADDTQAGNLNAVMILLREMKESLNTNKEELKNMNENMNNNKEEMKESLNKNKEELKNEMRESLNSNKEELKTEMNNIKIELSFNIEECKNTFETQIKELKNVQRALKEEIQEVKITQLQTDNSISELKQEMNRKIQKAQNETQETVELKFQQQCILIDNQFEKQSHMILSDVQNQLYTQNKNTTKQIEDLKVYNKIHTEKTSQAHCSKLKEEIQPQLDDHEQKLNEHREQIEEMKDNLKNTQNPFNWNNSPTINVTCTGADSTMNDKTMPRFSGRAHNPNEYLLKIKRYYEKHLTRNSNLQPIETLIDLLETSLEGHAARWFQLIKNDIHSWENFYSEFQSKYWNRHIQNNVKSRIEAENYRPQGTLTRAEYFIERVIALQSITPPMQEEEIVLFLAERFETLIQDSRSVQNVTSIRDFEQLLNREDLKDTHTRAKRNDRQPTTPPRQERSHHINPGAYHPRTQNQWSDSRQQQNSRNHFTNNNQQHQGRPHWQPSRHNQDYRNVQHNERYRPYNNRENHQNPRPYYNQQPQSRYPTAEQAKVCSIIKETGPRQIPNVPPEQNYNAANTVYVGNTNQYNPQVN